MPGKIGFIVAVLCVFFIATGGVPAQSGASARISATATVIVPVGFYDNSPEHTEIGPDSLVIGFCRPKHTGIIVSIIDGKGTPRQFAFPAGNMEWGGGKSDGAGEQFAMLERAVFGRGNYSDRDSCLVTIIFSEN